jgi:hypothetical protein
MESLDSKESGILRSRTPVIRLTTVLEYRSISVLWSVCRSRQGHCEMGEGGEPRSQAGGIRVSAERQVGLPIGVLRFSPIEFCGCAGSDGRDQYYSARGALQCAGPLGPIVAVIWYNRALFVEDHLD